MSPQGGLNTYVHDSLGEQKRRVRCGCSQTAHLRMAGLVDCTDEVSRLNGPDIGVRTSCHGPIEHVQRAVAIRPGSGPGRVGFERRRSQQVGSCSVRTTNDAIMPIWQGTLNWGLRTTLLQRQESKSRCHSRHRGPR